MARQVVWSNSSIKHLRETLEFFNHRNGNTNYSKKLFTETERYMELVSRFPEIGRKTTDVNVRRVVVLDSLEFIILGMIK